MTSARSKTVLALLLTLIPVLAGGCANGLEPEASVIRIEGTTMGTTYQVTVPDQAEVDGLADAIDSLLGEINASLSTYIPTSTITRINDERDPTVWHAVDAHFRAVLERSREIHDDTNGRFNPAVGPLVEAWGFGPQGASDTPSRDELAALISLADLDAFEYRETPPAIRKTVPGARLDFSGIAKGYAVDRMGALLEARGTGHYFVEIGGEVRTRGGHPTERGWRIGIEVPSTPGAARSAMAVIEVDDAALATSGDYRNVILLDDRTITHIFDPITGQPETTPLVSVSVLAPDVMTADAYATALMLMGPERAMEFVEERPDLEAYVVADSGDGNLSAARSTGFPEPRVPR